LYSLRLSPDAHGLDTASNSSSQLSESADQNTLSSSQLSEVADQNILSSSSSSASLTAALRNFDIGNISVNSIFQYQFQNLVGEHLRDVRGRSEEDSMSQMESYMEYLDLLNHRHAQEPVTRSSAAVNSHLGNLGTGVLESLSLLTNSTTLSFDMPLSDENDDYIAVGTRSNEVENDISSDSSVEANDFDDETSSAKETSSSAQNFLLPLDSSLSMESSPQPLELSSSTRLKISVLKWNVAATWKWTAGDETCGICRMPFEACCIECKTPGDECPLAIGACKHAFHMHCIVKWTDTQNTARPQCPLCRQEWKFAAG
uniref:Anaphase-promoting complex subunit 11 n=1 Tax=Thelazia callipaeda TaxID=103827 RepID=A0A0N5CL48_THECL